MRSTALNWRRLMATIIVAPSIRPSRKKLSADAQRSCALTSFISKLRESLAATALLQYSAREVLSLPTQRPLRQTLIDQNASSQRSFQEFEGRSSRRRLAIEASDEARRKLRIFFKTPVLNLQKP